MHSNSIHWTGGGEKARNDEKNDSGNVEKNDSGNVENNDSDESGSTVRRASDDLQTRMR